MKKVLIICYYFPPCNLTASERVNSWANYLVKFGYYPTIVSRRWDYPISKLSDISKSTKPVIIHSKHENYELFQLPYSGNLKDRIYSKFGEEKFTLIRKALSLIEILNQHWYTKFCPYSNLYEFSDRLLCEYSYDALIISGNPFIQFKFGYLLNKKHKIAWIADYRDAWTSTKAILHDKGFIQKLLFRIERRYEKKWLRTASHITGSSLPIVNSITNLTKIKSTPIYNGFNLDDFKEIKNTDKYNTFTISYIGTLYNGQEIEIFCKAFIKLIESYTKPNIRILFPGIALNIEQFNRINNALKGYENYFECTERMHRNKILEIEKKSHLLLHVAWTEFEGIIASKIYEYIASGTKILVTPSDHGSIEQIINSTKTGILTETVEDTYEVLKKEYENFQNGIIFKNNTETEEIAMYSREKQTEKLAQIFREVKS